MLEITEWLEDQREKSETVHALLLAEPVAAGSEEQLSVPAGYRLTGETAASERNKNPHLDTRAIYNDELADVTIIEATEETRPLHRGVTWIKVLSPEPEKRSMHENDRALMKDINIAAVYIPHVNKTNTAADVKSIYTALREQIARMYAKSEPVMIMMDTNCPHKAPEEPTSNRNREELYSFLEDTGMQVVNWTEKTKTGFHTRFAKGSSAQLDMVLANEAAIQRIDRLDILKDVSFGSDHVLLDMKIRHVKSRKQSTVPTEHTTYMWDELKCGEEYPESLKRNTRKWLEEAQEWRKKLEGETSTEKEKRRTNRAARKKLGKQLQRTTVALEKIILDTYKGVVPHRVNVYKHKNRHEKKPDVVLSELIKHREQMKHKLNEIQQLRASSEEITRAKKELSEAAGAVAHRLHHREDAAAAETVKKLEEAHKNKSDDFYSILNEAAKEPRPALPRTLVKNGQEIRKKEKIKEEWNKRYNLKPTPPKTEAHEAHREHIMRLNKARETNREYEEEIGNANFVLIDEIDIGCYKTAIDKLQTGKSPADDGITNEMVKRGRREMRELLLCLYNILLEVEMIPKHWKKAIYVPVYKKGERRTTKNHRPIGKTPVLYKVYERILDDRMRCVIKLPPEQTGFRSKFSTHTKLMRIDILMEYCSARGLDLRLITTDFQEAFERAWRDGILHRLWIAGIRGKMWRIARDLLTGTLATVRTNYGDTDAFETIQGVVQGSVLAALFFTVLVTPMSTELKHMSMILEGIPIAPQLYADDCTTPTQGEENTERMLTAIIEWSELWGLIVKAEKSAILKAKRNKERCRTQTIEIQGMLFQHKSALKLLGLQLDGEAAMGAQQAHAVMNQVAKRLRRVTKQISKSGKVTTGVIMRVFDLIATSTCAYSLPHARRAQGPAAIIQTKKMDLLIEMLKLTKDTPHESLRADLGVLDVDIELAVLHLRALHKIYNNREDNLTREMLKWNLKKGATPTSKLDEAQKMLKVLGLDMEISIFLKNTYDRMKELLKQASKKQSAARWTKNTKDGSEEGKRQSHIKPK